MPRGTKRKLPENVEEVGEDDTRLLQPDPGRGFIDFEKIIRASKIVLPINTRNVEGCGVSGESTLSFPVGDKFVKFIVAENSVCRGSDGHAHLYIYLNGLCDYLRSLSSLSFRVIPSY